MNCTSSSCKKNRRKESLAKDLAYRERNLMVKLFSRMAHHHGWLSVLWPESDEWWILFVETPHGQMSWHLRQKEAIEFFWAPTAKTNPWDGHSTETKNERIEDLICELQ